MNDIINLASTSQSKNSVTSASSRANSSQDGSNAVHAAGKSDNEHSFQESIEKAYDDFQQEKEHKETEPGGNDLPESNDLAGPAEDDDRLFSAAEFNEQVSNQESAQASMPGQIADQLSAQNKSITPARIQSVSADIMNNVDNNLGSLSSTEQVALAGNKSPSLMNSGLMTGIQQQQTLLNSQASMLSPPVSAQAGTTIDSLPFSLTSTLNNASAMELQSLPQAEIVETFARPPWSQGMGKQILWMVNQNISSAEIRLNPAHLGPIEVLIDMSEDQVNVSLSSRHAVVREAMEQALPKLREMLNASGFNLADADISQHSFAQQREQNTGNGKTGFTGDSAGQSLSSEISEQAIKHISTSTAMVDYYI